MASEWALDDGVVVSDDPTRLDIDMVHAFLTSSYWAMGIPRDVVERSITNSLAFGIYVTDTDSQERQVGFARVVSDRATFAYMADVFVVERYRGRGLSKFLMACIVAHPELQGLRQWMLLTSSAHGLYEQFGFAVTKTPERVMQMRPEPTYGSNSVKKTEEGSHG